MQNLAPINQDNDFVTKAYVDSLFAGSGGGGGTTEPSDLTEKVTALENDVKTLLGYFTGTKAKDADKLDGYDSSAFALAASLGALATKDNIAFSELTSKPTTLAGYGITDALGKNETAASATKLATPRKIWGQDFDGTKDVNGTATFGGGAKIAAGQALSFLDSAGDEHKIVYDETAGVIKVVGAFASTGENSAGGAGEELLDFEQMSSRLATVETEVENLKNNAGGSAINNIEIKVSSLDSVLNRNINTTAMANQFGLSVTVANNMLNGAFNKVVDKTNPSYPSAYDYTAYSTDTQIKIFLTQGNGQDIKAYCLTLTKSTLMWVVTK